MTTKAGDVDLFPVPVAVSNGRLSMKLPQISTQTLYCQKLESVGYIIVADSSCTDLCIQISVVSSEF